MAEINYFEIIQNKLDALVEKIIQKENSDENFRITYAQILEKINTKMDLFANNDASERINILGSEIGKLMRERQEVVDAKFATVKGEFDNLNQILAESLKTPELLAAFNKIQNQIHYFSEEQENQKFAFNSIVAHIEKFGTLEETNDSMRANFAIVKEQNTIINENVNKQMDLLKQFNESVETHNKQALEDLNTIIFSLKEFSESVNDDAKEVKEFVNSKVDSIIKKIHETDSFIEVLNTNLTTLVQVVGNIFDDEEFASLRDDVADVLVKINILSEALNNIATKSEMLENSEKNKEEIKQHNLELITNLETKILSKLDFSDLNQIKDCTEKMFFQGTEVLKEEMWSLKDSVSNIEKISVTKEDFDKKLEELNTLISEQTNLLRDDITDVISEESVAASNQIAEISDVLSGFKSDFQASIADENAKASQKMEEVSDSLDILKYDIKEIVSAEAQNSYDRISEISATIDTLKKDISDIILNEQNEQISDALKNLQNKFVTQLIQIADNISFSAEAEDINDSILNCSDEIKQKISEDIQDIKQEIELLKGVSDTENENIVNLLTRIDDALQSDISKDLKTLISGFKLLTNGLKEEKDYVYTLPDIESDLSKIRLDLRQILKLLVNVDGITEENSTDISSKINNIKQAIDKLSESPITAEVSEIKALFDGLNEDIASISKRTNKLIIASDETNKVLRANIQSFTSLINAFEKQSREFYNSAFLRDTSARVDNIAQSVNAILKSDQVLNEAFMYMGEWIDSASDSFDEIKNDLTKIKRNLMSDEETPIEKLEMSFRNLCKKVEFQDARIEAIDDKLNKIISQQNETKELKSLIEYVASQVSVTNEKIIENEKFAQKINNMEKQLKKIEKNVAVITEFIDEEESDEFEEEDMMN